MIERDYVRYAIDNYQAPMFSTEEFMGDLNKVIVLKKMLRRYSNTGMINERLALNLIILILNQFGVGAGNIILFYKVEPEHHDVLKTFLTYLNSFSNCEYANSEVGFDPIIVEKLKDIACRSYLA